MSFYIRNAKVERLYSVQEYILELWTVDPKVTKPFYLSENTIQFVTDDNEYRDPRKQNSYSPEMKSSSPPAIFQS